MDRIAGHGNGPSPLRTSVEQVLKRSRHIIRSLGAENSFGRYINTLVILLWIWLLYYGERAIFDRAINRCHWNNWESWPANARPYHLALIADPQLVDPHTYPGRPWPLSHLTVTYTDRYLKRSFTRLQRRIDPDSIYFLGDLFDGGREWRTRADGFKATVAQWEPYGHRFWLKEYNRFANIFFAAKDDHTLQHRDRHVFTNLPGNHDIGFGPGVQPVVRNRFQTFFGEPNRIDLLGNHTLVGLDTLSLSAMEDPNASEAIWRPTSDFLDTAQMAIRTRMQRAFFTDAHARYEHAVAQAITAGSNDDSEHARRLSAMKHNKIELPTIAFTHVPFYREPGTPCGPQRERDPPTRSGLDSDEPNAIRIAGGYQYQNVLSRDVSKLIADKIGHVSYIFSGDDHDYCEVTHSAYASAGAGIKEITVKSMSWAMGIRKPGFLLVSLWNPIDEFGQPLQDGQLDSKKPTVQTHLCLLPDQLGVFIRYLWCLMGTTLVLSLNARVHALRERLPGAKDAAQDSILPMVRVSVGSSSASNHGADGAARSGARARSSSQASALSSYGLLRSEKSARNGRNSDELKVYRGAWNDEVKDFEKPKRRSGFYRLFWRRFCRDMVFVACVTLPLYALLLYSG